MSEDMVHKPPHYNKSWIETIDGIHAMLGKDEFVAYCRGNAMKYIWRAGQKGSMSQDLDKAAKYLEFADNALKGLTPHGKPLVEINLKVTI